MPVLIDLTDQTFERLSVLGPVKDKHNRTVWQVICKCSAVFECLGSNLRTGKTTSCGCRKKDFLIAMNYRHGQTGTALYKLYLMVKQRCGNPKYHQFADYGGRGIRMCDRWERSFEAFAADMGPRPPGYTLERKSNDDGYTPGNCIWATRKAQQRNRRVNTLIDHGGLSLTAPEWSERTGLNVGTIEDRLRSGWTPARALTAPVRGSNFVPRAV